MSQELNAKKIKEISDEVIIFIKDKTKSNKVHVINFVLDQAKIDVAVENRLNHYPIQWGTEPEI